MSESKKEADFEGANFDGADFQEETGDAKEVSEFFDGFEEKEPSEQGQES